MSINIAITGSSSAIAGVLLRNLLSRKDISMIRGLDIVKTEVEDPKFEFFQGNVRSKDDLRKCFKGIDVVIHLAFVVFSYPRDDTHREEIREINVNGSKNVFTVAANTGVNKIIYLSSVASYGFHTNKDVIENPLSEDDPIQGGEQDIFYFEDKAEVEFFLDQFQKEHTDITISRIRPHVLVGPDFFHLVNLKPYKDGLGSKIYSRIRQPGQTKAVEQLVHQEDVYKAIQWCIDNDYNGAMNVAGDPVDISSYLKSKDIWLVQVPYSVARAFLRLKAIFSDIAKLELYWTRAMVYPVIVSNEKYKVLIGNPISTKDILDEIYNYVRND